MGSLPIRVGLVDMTGEADASTMAAVAAALNVQVTRDLPQFWNVEATVEYLANKDQIPQGVWPVQLVKSLPPGEGGFHMTKRNQPYAKVIYTPGSLEWTIDASHEILEMLVDPGGNRMQVSEAIAISGNGVADVAGEQFEYLIELCDPCEADDCAYQIDGFAVSDFITPHFYDSAETAGARYSFTGAIKKPRQLLQGGYISFVDTKSGRGAADPLGRPGTPTAQEPGVGERRAEPPPLRREQDPPAQPRAPRRPAQDEERLGGAPPRVPREPREGGGVARETVFVTSGRRPLSRSNFLATTTGPRRASPARPRTTRSRRRRCRST